MPRARSAGRRKARLPVGSIGPTGPRTCGSERPTASSGASGGRLSIPESHPVEGEPLLVAAGRLSGEKAEQAVRAEFEEVTGLGGLYVLGTERHESRRIDNQLRGRSGRQGDPGESRFYLSLGDDLMRLFKAQMVERVMAMANVPDDVPIENKMVTRAIASAQSQVEQQNFEIRKNVLKYDDVMNKQRQVIYDQRGTVLEGADEEVGDIAEDFIEDAINQTVALYAPEGVFGEEWDLEELWNALQAMYPISLDRDEIAGRVEDLDHAQLVELVTEDAFARYEEREAELGEDILRKVERRVILTVVDRIWREHLYEMDHLREGIGLRAVGQRDPLVEYQREAYDAFQDMMARIKVEATGYFYNLPVHVEEEQQEDGETKRRGRIARPALKEEPRQPAQRLQYTSSTTTGTTAGGGASYSVSAGGERASFLSERQFLLGLDLLRIVEAPAAAATAPALDCDVGKPACGGTE